MNRRIAFRGMDHSDSIEQHALNQLKKIERLLVHEPTPITIDIVLEAARTHHHHRAEILVKTPHHDLCVHDEKPDMYMAIDSVIKTMHELIVKEKEKMVDNKKHSGTIRKL